MLQDIENNLEAEQDTDDAFIEKFQAECDEEITKLDQEIKDAIARSKELKAELEEKIPIRDEKVRLLKDKKEFEALLEAKIAELDQAKAHRDEEWAKEQEEHDSATYVIERAKEIIKQGLTAGSFLQKSGAKASPEAFVQVSEHFKTSAKKVHFVRKSWNSIFKLLSQITSSAPVQASASGVEKIINICDELLNKIAESREVERRAYQHWVSEYETTRAGVVSKLDEIKGQIGNLETEIAALNKRITNATNEKAEQDTRAANKQKQHDEKLQQCDDENIQYSERRDQRDQDKEIVSQTIGLLQAKLRTFRKYVNDRLGKVEKAKF